MVRVSEKEINRLIEPADSRKKDLDPNSGVSALRSTMRSLREELETADVELLESKIAEGEQPAEWSSPIA
jgi:hypothetical protein